VRFNNLLTTKTKPMRSHATRENVESRSKKFINDCTGPQTTIVHDANKLQHCLETALQCTPQTRLKTMCSIQMIKTAPKCCSHSPV